MLALYYIGTIKWSNFLIMSYYVLRYGGLFVFVFHKIIFYEMSQKILKIEEKNYAMIWLFHIARWNLITKKLIIIKNVKLHS